MDYSGIKSIRLWNMERKKTDCDFYSFQPNWYLYLELLNLIWNPSRILISMDLFCGEMLLKMFAVIWWELCHQWNSNTIRSYNI